MSFGLAAAVTAATIATTKAFAVKVASAAAIKTKASAASSFSFIGAIAIADAGYSSIASQGEMIGYYSLH